MKKLLMFGAIAAMVCSSVTVNAEEDKTWVIATDTVFRPFEYTDESGELVGIDVDIVKAIAEDQGFNYEMKSLGWDAAIAACQAGQANGMIAGASITDERKESGWMFSDGYYDATQSMAVKTGSDIAGFGDLDGKTVGVKTGTQGAAYAESLKDEYKFNITYFEDSPTMYQAVAGGQVVACFEDTPIMLDSIKANSLEMEVVEGTENEGSPYGFAIFSEDNQELLDMFNAGLANIKEDGTYDEIISRYLSTGEEEAETDEADAADEAETEEADAADEAETEEADAETEAE